MTDDSDQNHQVGGPIRYDAEAGEHNPAGEEQGVNARFTATQVADAFEVAIDRVHNAFAGEYDMGPEGTVDSRQAQDLSELIIGDRPQGDREAALMKLGAFTPRRDTLEASFYERPDGELSDRLRPSEQQPIIGAPRDTDQ